jgi:MFS family permease
MALTAGGLAGVLGQIPVGAWVDVTRRKRALVCCAILATAASAIVLALGRSLPIVLAAQAVHGAATTVMGPTIVALSLGMAARGELGQRLGRNRRFDSAGNLSSAALMGWVGYAMSPVAIFWVTALLAIPAIGALGLIDPRDIDDAAARGSAPSGPPARWADLATNRRFLTFMACAVLFHFANASMLPLVATVLGSGKARESSLLLSACIMTTQVVVMLSGPWCGRQAERWGRRPLLLVGFALMPLRGVLFSLTTRPVLLVAIQILDGLAGTIFMIVAPLVVADVTRGTGRFNLAQGTLGTATAAGAAVSTTAAGYVVDRFGDAAGFRSLAAVALLGLVLLFVAMPETSPESESTPDLRRLKDESVAGAKRPAIREIEDAR